mgnify:CR=1 FL=1
MMLLLTMDAYWQVFGRFHPLLIHFPLALILVAACIEGTRYAIGRRDQPSPTAAICLWIGLVMGGLALWAGWVLADYTGEEGALVSLHRWTGVATISLLVLAAAALTCIGGQMQGRLIFRNDDERGRAHKAGIDDLKRKYDLSDLAHGDVLFAATGVTDGSMLQGVKRYAKHVTTESIVMRARTGTVRWIRANHDVDRALKGTIQN